MISVNDGTTLMLDLVSTGFVIHGGFSSSVLSDVWFFNASSLEQNDVPNLNTNYWTLLHDGTSPTPVPPPRGVAAAIAFNGNLVLFGGAVRKVYS